MLTVNWKPNKKSNISLYKQIVYYIKNKIATGAWPVNSKLPSQRAMAQAFQVNRSTLITALDELIADGFLKSKVGSGLWVINNSWSLLSSENYVNWNSHIDQGVIRSNFNTIQEINRLEINPSLIRLGTGELSPDFYPEKEMNTIFSKLSGSIASMGYEEPKGSLFLRQQISGYLKTFGINASPASIMIVSGALQALQLTCFGLLRKGTTVFLEKPSYLFSLRLFQSMKMHFSGLSLDSEGIQLAAVSDLCMNKNAAVLYTIPCFHNPTGILMTEKRRNDLIALCQYERLPIIEDDVYRELWLDFPPPPALKAMDKEGLVLYLGSLSKTLSPGLRIGWIVGPEQVIEQLADIKMQTDYGASSLSQWVAAEWLSNGLYQEYLDKVRVQLRIRRNAVCKTLKTYFSDIATWNIPQGGFYIWLSFNYPISLKQLFKICLEQGLLINCGNLYDHLSSQHLRISYAYASITDLNEGLYRLSILARTLLTVSVKAK